SYNVNVRGPFVAVKAALPHFQPGGRIITIGSIVSSAGRGPGSTVYGVTKAAVARMVRGLAWDLSERKITVNDVQPGPVATDMNPLDGEHAEYLINANPMKRFGEPHEIANLVAWLAGPESSYVNGACMAVDGGLTA
ncbi:SDR family oxidoreductase, partial [Pseudocitrobacter faecalis]